jgi:hypothetical protein
MSEDTLDPAERAELLATVISETISCISALAVYGEDMPIARGDIVSVIDTFFDVTDDVRDVVQGTKLINIMREKMGPVRALLGNWQSGEIPPELTDAARAFLAELAPFGINVSDERNG